MLFLKDKNMQTRKFLQIFLLIIFIFVSFHASIWYFYTSQIFDRQDKLYVGDLGRVSYQIDSLHPRKLEYTLPKKHFNANNWHGEKIDIITVGDSFSNADMGGRNPYYQDYLATFYNKNILNLHRNSEELNSLELLIGLYNNGWLKKYKPKFVILQMVERFSIEAHAKDIDWKFTIDPTQSIIADLKTKDSHIPQLKLINTANYKFLLYTLKYKFSKRGYKYYPKLSLNQHFFSQKHYSDNLLFHFEDVKYANAINDSRIDKLNKNLNKLAKLLKTLDIQLFYMPAVDKYDLYYDYIKNNPFPQNHYFNLLEKQEKEYILINTKTILLEALKDGEIDIFYADDTHWSYKASEKIATNEVFQRLIN